MNFDRNTVIGFISLALLFIGYFYFTTREQQAYQSEKARLDSIELAKRPKIDSSRQQSTITRQDTAQVKPVMAGIGGTEQLRYVETNLVKVAFTNKGGQPKWVELKKFKGPDSSNVKLAASDFDKLSYSIIQVQVLAILPVFIFQADS
jgi:YidC/Oxa1 family membrane protein insertase